MNDPVDGANGDDWRVVEGDCVEVLRSLPERPRLIFADPPYNIGVEYGPHMDDSRTPESYIAWTREWIDAAAAVLAPDGSLWVLIEPRWAGRVQCALEDSGLHYRETIIWHETFGVYCETKFGKDHRSLFRFAKHRRQQVFHPDRIPSARLAKYRDKRANPQGRVPPNVWPISRVCGTFRERLDEFPTQLPLELLRRVVRTASDPGDLVLDPFSGSATTGVAAIEQGRRYLGIELSGKYAELSRRRLGRATTQGTLFARFAQ